MVNSTKRSDQHGKDLERADLRANQIRYMGPGEVAHILGVGDLKNIPDLGAGSRGKHPVHPAAMAVDLCTGRVPRG
jgi:hypothetical protein